MTLDRDPMADRLVDAWLDEGPRTFSPRRLDRTLAEIHATTQRRQRPLPWSIPRMNLTFFTGLAGAAVLAILFAAGAYLPWLPATIFGPATTPTPIPTVAASPGPSGIPAALSSPEPLPAPAYIPGKVPLVGTAWQLVGRIDDGRADGDPAYISPDAELAPPTLRFTKNGRVAGQTGCHPFQGSWDANPTGAKTFPADLTVGESDTVGCPVPPSSQEADILAHLDTAGAMQVTAGGYDLLASGLTDADLDAALLAHYQAHPDLVHLIIRDQSGEGTLIYAPVMPDLGSLLGRSWQIAGYRSDAGTLVTTADPSATTIRFDADGTFSATAGCATFDGTWGSRPVPDASPVPGGMHVDVAHLGGDCRTPESDALSFLLSEADLGLGHIETTHPAAAMLPGDAADDLLARFTASEDTDWVILRDAERMDVLVLSARASEAPVATPSAAPAADVAFAAGEVPLAGTTWAIVGYQATFDADTGPTYAAVLPGTTPYLRISEAGTVIGSFGGCELFTGAMLRDPTGGSGPLFRETDLASSRGCSAASVRQAARLEGLFGQASVIDQVAPGLPTLAPGITDERVAQALRDHFAATPDVGHLVLRDGTADAAAVLVLAPVAGGLDPAVQPHPDPAPGRQPAPVLAGDRALTDDAWLLVGWRDADGRMRMDSWDWATQLGFAAGEGTTSGGFSGTIPCGVIDGQWTGAILDASTGSGPFTFSGVNADPAPDCYAAAPAQIDAIRAGLEGAASVAVGPQEVQLDIAGVPKTEMDPWLWAWLAANQDARLLVLRDADGATSLVFAPVAASTTGG